MNFWVCGNNSIILTFNYLEFEAIKNDSGSNAFVMTPKNGMTDIHAIEWLQNKVVMQRLMLIKTLHLNLLQWISPEFKLYITRIING